MRIMHIKNTIRNWSDKFQYCFLKALADFRISIIIIELIPLNKNGQKKRVLEVLMLKI